MTRIGCLILVVCFLASAAYGQTVNALPSTVSTFPQAVDGTLSDGSYWGTILWVENTGTSTATCTLKGPLSARFGQPNFLVPVNYKTEVLSKTTDALQSGIVQLSCDQPMLSSLTYISFLPNGVASGMATVLPARAVSVAAMSIIPIRQFGIAIANITASTLILDVRFNRSNGQVVTGTITVPPASQYVKFVHEILNISPTDDGVFIVTNFQSAVPFYIMGLMFKGTAFTTLVPSGS